MPKSNSRQLSKSELFAHFAERFDLKRTQAREYFDELTALAERELKRTGEFELPGVVKLVVRQREARMGRNPATGEAISIPARTVVKARVSRQLKALAAGGLEGDPIPPPRPKPKKNPNAR